MNNNNINILKTEESIKTTPNEKINYNYLNNLNNLNNQEIILPYIPQKLNDFSGNKKIENFGKFENRQSIQNHQLNNQQNKRNYLFNY